MPPKPHRRSPAAVAGMVISIVAVVAALGYGVAALMPRVVFEGEGAFGRVRVVERGDGLRILYTGDGRARQSAIYPGRPLHLELAYTRVAAIGLALAPPDRRLLFVGLGGGAMPMHARAVLPDARLEVVEIDPLIVDVARRYFGFRPDDRLIVHTGDGRAFIEAAAPASYDAIVLDAFSDDEIPFALTTREFLESVRSRLSPGGIVVSNLWTENRAYRSMVSTYRAVFDQVHLIRVGGRPQRILVAGSGERPLGRSALVHAARRLAARADLGFDLTRLVEVGYERPPPSDAPVLRDHDRNALGAGPVQRRGRTDLPSRLVAEPQIPLWLTERGVWATNAVVAHEGWDYPSHRRTHHQPPISETALAVK